ncbi:MAG: hypothetical protein RL688_702, partial [Actinomycetota bacterium]
WPAAGLAAAVGNAHVPQTDMHVQHSERAARDQLVISQLPTDSAQVAPNVESMPEQAVVNSTTHDAAQSANSSCSGGGEVQEFINCASEVLRLCDELCSRL